MLRAHAGELLARFDLARDNDATVYYMPGTASWSMTFAGRPMALWNPQVQASGSTFGVRF
jgi:hypothetical protein